LRIKELPDEQWALIHKLNGQLIQALQDVLVEEINWNPKEWIVTVLVLQRAIEETEEAVLKTSSTMLNGKIFDVKDECDIDEGVGDLNRIVPLVKSFAGYCIRSGSAVWVDNIENHPLRDEYRLYEYVNIRPRKIFVAEYVFPVWLKVGVNRTIIGVLNAETSRTDINEFREAGLHHVSALVSRLLDTHAPFLVLSQLDVLAASAAKSLLRAHHKVLDSTVAAMKNK
jgi:hypothetical protein